MRKALVLAVALMTFSAFSPSVSPNVAQYYATRFYVHANGSCEAYRYGGGSFLGRGSVYIRGLSVVRREADHYWAYKPEDPNTRVWTRRTSMKVHWNNEKLMVHMWPSDNVAGFFLDEENVLDISDLNFMGYYIDASDNVQFIWGTAHVDLWVDAEVTFLVVYIFVQTGEYFEFDFAWYSDETRSLRYRIAVWPIEKHPSTPGYYETRDSYLTVQHHHFLRMCREAPKQM